MPFQNNDSVDSAKNSARNTADESKRAAKDAEKETKQWGKNVQDSAGNAWEQTKSWGQDRRRDIDNSFDGFVDLGHPLVNRVFDGFVKVGGVGALHAAAQDSYKYLTADESSDKKSLENSAHRVGKDGVQWGLVAGVYSGVTYGIAEARGVHDWKNALLGGALTGAALSLTETNPGPDRVFRGAITGGAIATAAEILRAIS